MSIYKYIENVSYVWSSYGVQCYYYNNCEYCYVSRPAKAEVCRLPDVSTPPENEAGGQLLDTKRDDMLARRIGTFQKCARLNNPSPASEDSHGHVDRGKASEQMMDVNSQPLQEDNQHVWASGVLCIKRNNLWCGPSNNSEVHAFAVTVKVFF